MRIQVQTNAGKLALAEALKRHDPVTLQWLADMAQVFGAFGGVEYESEDPEVQEAVEVDVRAAKAKYIAAERERAKSEIGKMKGLTK